MNCEAALRAEVTYGDRSWATGRLTHAYLSYSFEDKRSCPICDKVLAELEDIDDDTARFGVHLVKIADKKLARSHGVKNFPALTYFRNSEPIHYEGADMKLFEA
ncbi:hypothetical protein HAZT_HAZT000146 [Hyalella azteca]|uniref:Thioredoxin domain-containing protein n=1 Tax=Hyalella azteca TaxID=294128 RepID=A0A6A0H0Y9_HYAAZ|nr:hypothetical protein HAZT_HAZT000146 [Hyalella azteca]